MLKWCTFSSFLPYEPFASKMKLFYPLSSHSHKNCRQSEVSNGCFADPKQSLVTDFQSSSKSPASICVWWRMLRPWGIWDLASSLTLGITKVLVFKAAVSPPGVSLQTQFMASGRLQSRHSPSRLCLLLGDLWRVSQWWPPEHGLLPVEATN